ncbi:MAG: carboxymuconolactone decarboxylase family protein [Myxococcota bacterium]
MPAIPTSERTDAQRAAITQFERTRGKPPDGPFIPLLRCPEILRIASALGRYLRFESSLPGPSRELAILLAAKRWSQGYEWASHRPIAESVGLTPALIDAVARGHRPDAMSRELAVAYDLCVALHRDGQVDDALYTQAVTSFGERGVIELAAICGYYSTLAMVMNLAHTPDPSGFAWPTIT